MHVDDRGYSPTPTSSRYNNVRDLKRMNFRPPPCDHNTYTMLLFEDVTNWTED